MTHTKRWYIAAWSAVLQAVVRNLYQEHAKNLIEKSERMLDRVVKTV